MRKARERGTICLYVAVCLVALGLLTGALVPLATNFQERTTRRNDELRARLAFEAGVATIKSQSLAMTLVLGSTLPISINGTTGTLTTTANDAQIAKTIVVTGTIVRKGQTYRYSRVIGARQLSPFLFALMSKADVTSLKKITLGANGWGGDAFSDGKFNINGSGSTVNGNLASILTVGVQSDTVVTGRTLMGQRSVTWPTLTASNYSNLASSLLVSGKGLIVYSSVSLNSVTFPSYGTSDYAMYYYGSNLTLSGTISGRGTIYVAGNLTISGNLRYASSSDEVAIIVSGNITVSSSTDTIDGYYFSNGTLSDSKGLTLSRGAMVANTYGTDKDLTIVRDDAVMNDTNEAVRLRLPYYWP